MIRVLLLNVLLFLLPFAIYACYAILAGRKEGESLWEGAPLFALTMIGFGAAFAGLFIYAVVS